MRKKLLCAILSLVLFIGMLTCFPTVRAASSLVSSDSLVEYIKVVEGFSAYPYWDHGQYTVGYGTRCPSDKYNEYSQVGISQEAAVALLKQELVYFEGKVNGFIDTYGLTLNQHQFDALVTFTYNCGEAWLSETDGIFNQAVRNGATGNALIYALTLWSTAGGEFILLDRRLSEANMYLNGQYTPYNGIDPAYPDSYRWVFLNGAGGQAKYRIFAYDSATPTELNVEFKSVPEGYTFAGWYTASGIPVTTLDSSFSRDQVLYARWQHPNGQVIPLSSDGPVNMNVTVIESSVNLRQGPGTHSPKVGTVQAGDVLTVTELHTTSNYIWGKTALGWIAMQFTDGSTPNNGVWMLDNDRWAYYINGQPLKNGWAQDTAGWCYLGADGYMVKDSWVQDDQGWCYVDESGYRIHNAWIEDYTGLCYIGSSGYLSTSSWVQVEDEWCYVDANGHKVYGGWVENSSGWYYLGSDGNMIRSTWVLDENNWCFVGSDGRRLENAWAQDSAGWCYLGADGYMVKNNWIYDGTGWCYMDASGYRICDTWFRDSVGWCYLAGDGYLVTNNWIMDDIDWCYVTASGYRLTNAWMNDTAGWCYLDGEGHMMRNAWVQDTVGWCYINSSGYIVYNTWVLDHDLWYYVDESGYRLENTWKADSTGWCYLGEDGSMVTARWVEAADGRYYCDATGHRVTGTQTIDGKVYHFDENGLLTDRYTITFADWDGTVLSTGDYPLEAMPQIPADPVRPPEGSTHYTFAGWTPAVTPVTGSITYTATYEATQIIQNQILEEPADVSLSSGEDACFRVVTQGEVVSYQWEYRAIWKWFSTSLEGCNTDTLTVPAVGSRNGYDYRCTVTFADGTVLVSQPAQLTVQTQITNVTSPQDQVAVLGAKAQFTASAQGEGIKYQWQYCRPGSERWSDTTMEGCTKPTVLIETTTARNGYRYRCRITDVVGNAVYTAEATMYVLSFTAQPQDVTARAGETVTFTVQTSVAEGFTYRWQYSRNGGQSWSDTNMEGYNTDTLQVSASAARNGYLYRCVITGAKNGQLASDAACLTVTANERGDTLCESL